MKNRKFMKFLHNSFLTAFHIPQLKMGSFGKTAFRHSKTAIKFSTNPTRPFLTVFCPKMQGFSAANQQVFIKNGFVW
ncbi:MAG: hypothetical protein ABFR90_08035 [Planctomycetota bacterium]